MQNPIKNKIQERKKLFWKLGLGILAVILLLSTFSLNSTLFKGDIFSNWTTTGTGDFYIPDYPASVGDVGDIQIVSTNAYTNLSGFSFTLVYNSNNISIPDNAVSATGFDFVNSNNIAPGRLKVIGASGNLNGISLWSGANLVTINELTLNTNLSEGEVLNLEVEDFEIVTSINGTLTSVSNAIFTPGKITIGSTGTLKLLSAFAVDNTTVQVTFSDYITTTGSFTFDNGLLQNSVSIDPNDGKSVLVKTSTQTQGISYEVTSASTVGNTEGSLSINNTGYFTGIGTITVASDFHLNSASAISATGVTLYFSDEILDGSIYKTAFKLNETNTLNSLTILSAKKSTTNNKAIELLITGNPVFESSKNYQVTVSNSGLSTDLRRKSDNALLGQDIVTFAGYATTPAVDELSVSSAQAVANNQVVVKFSENLAANTIDSDDFSISGQAVNVALIPYNGAYNEVLLTLTGSLVAGQYYTLFVDDTYNGLEAYSGNSLGSSNTTTFVGFGTYANTSNLALNSAVANSSTEIKLTFSEAPLVSTISPVNFEIKPSLTITNVAVVDKTVTLTTALQTEETLYTVIAKADKIKDKNEFLISANNTTTFNAYQEINPVVDSVTPSQIVNNPQQTILIAGSNFESGTKIYINTLELTATVQADQISAIVPVDTLAGAYDLILERPNGEQIELQNALVIEDPVQNIAVLSSDSYASPQLVPNDGETTTTLWVRISDPKGVSDIDQVYLDLRPINGSPAITMVAGSIVDTKRWYSLEITVPNTVQTSAVPLALQVTAQNKAGDKAFGTVQLTVNNDITTSIPPNVEQAYSTPGLLKPGSDEDVYFYAYVTDGDGANTLNTVVINLGPIGGAPMLMEPVTASSGTGNLTSINWTDTFKLNNKLIGFLMPKVSADFSAPTSNGQWYKTTQAFRLSTNMRNESYLLDVTATDNTGETGSLQFTVQTSVYQNKPFIDEDKVYVTPRESIPNDNMTTFEIYAYVEDPDGISDISSVTVDLEEINLPPATMTTTSTSGLGGWYKTPELKIPLETFQGIQTLDIYARDISGAEGEAGLQIKVTNLDELGDAPEVSSGKSYTTPNVSINDETTKLTLYAYVSDKDEDIDYVMVNLTNVALYTGAIDSTNSDNMSGYYDYSATNTAENPCETSSDTILCMYPSVQEWSDGGWYVLSDVVILKEAIPSTEPYRIWVTAIDKTGKSTKGYININVTDGKTPVESVSTPTLQLASATSLNSVEVLLSNPIDAADLSKTGKEFQITEKNNTSAKVGISKSVINTEGNIITLTTSEQTPGTTYTVVADADTLGLNNIQASDVLADFIWYQDSDIPPQIDMVTSNSSYLVEVVFSNAIQPTSVNADGSDFEIFTAEGSAEDLAVHRAKIEDQYTIVVTTDAQTSNQKYRIRIKNIKSAAGQEVKTSGLTSLFKGFQNIVHESSELNVRADFNGDGKVDFTDFTMFSAVYGEMWSSLKSGDMTTLDQVVETTGIQDVYSPTETTTPVPLTD